MKVIVNAAGGQMGKLLAGLAKNGCQGAELVAAVESFNKCDELLPSLDAYQGEADVIIDFSHASGTDTVLDYAVARKIPLVLGTTGQTDAQKEHIAEAAKTIPVFYAHNMALGVLISSELCKMAAKAFPEAEIEIIEYHHNRKVDVPSGTALMFADAIKEVRPEVTYNIGRPNNGKRDKNEIGLHAIRFGNVVGVHEIMFETGSQRISIKHEAHDRGMFAEGAMTAAAFLIKQKPGLYAMKDMIGNI